MAACAVLILSAYNPENLRFISQYFDALGCDVYVHVDQKVDIEPFRQAVSTFGENARIIDKRVNVYWRGFSMIVATTELINAARRQNDYDYYVLISDDCLPILPISAASARLSSARNILDAYPKPLAKIRYEGFYMLDSNATSIRWLPIEARTLTEDALEKFARLGALMAKGKAPIQKLCHGSQWWALNRDAVSMFMNSYNSDTWVRESFEFSEVPDEGYIQTVLAAQVENASSILMHTDWSVPQGHGPKVFTDVSELVDLNSTGCMFVRKVRLEPAVTEKYIRELIEH